MVEQGFELSEASSTPVMLELRIRACRALRAASRPARIRRRNSPKKAFLQNPDFDYGKICLPPATYAQEKHKVDVRWPAAVHFIRERKLNEFLAENKKNLASSARAACTTR